MQNRIAEFHTELELLPSSALENPCIKHAIELEQSFMDLLAKTLRYVKCIIVMNDSYLLHPFVKIVSMTNELV